MELDRQVAGARRGEDPAGLLGREGDLLAEGIHRIGKPGDGGQHLLHHAVDIGPAAAFELRRQGMGAEEAGPDRHALQAPGGAKHLGLVCGIEAVARFDLEGGHALAAEGIDPALRARHQIVFRGGAGLGHGRADAAAGACDLLIACPLQPELELARPVAGIDEMGMAIDQARRQPGAGQIMDMAGELFRRSRQVRPRTDPGDAPFGGGDGAIFDRAIGRAARCHGGEPAVHPEIVPHAVFLWNCRAVS
jgi:hypothetical protein